MRSLSSKAKVVIDKIFQSVLITIKNKDSTKNKSQVLIPPGFKMVKGPAADTGGWASVIRHKATGIEMVYVAPGEFVMGSPLSEKGRDDDELQHMVTLTKGYYIGKYPVTQGQWKEVTGKNPSQFKGSNLPVEKVSWDDCRLFCEKIGSGFRLPTEAEWEYAARGGNRSKGYIYSGSNNLDEVGWHASKAGKKTKKVGAKKANELGIYDMSGNVWEWCADWYANYSAVTDPMGGDSGSDRVCRGGGWNSFIKYCRTAERGKYTSGLLWYDLGVRLALSAVNTR